MNLFMATNTFEPDAIINMEDGCPNCGGRLTIAKPGRGWDDFLLCVDCGTDHGEVVYV